jgi:hypothetical protein
METSRLQPLAVWEEDPYWRWLRGTCPLCGDVVHAMYDDDHEGRPCMTGEWFCTSKSCNWEIEGCFLRPGE